MVNAHNAYAFCEHQEKQNVKHSFYLGGLGLLIPKYDGASSYRLLLVPNFTYKYFNHIIVSPYRGLGLNLFNKKPLHYSFGIRYKFWFRSKRSNRFKGINDLKPYWEGYAVVKYKIKPIVFRLGGYYSLNKPSIGGFIRTGASCFVKLSEDVDVFFGPSIKISNQKHMQTLYGVSKAESNSSGQPVYKVHAGIEDFRLNLGINYQMHKSWNCHLMFSVKRALDQGAKSPLIENKIQYFGNLSVNYKFQ